MSSNKKYEKEYKVEAVKLSRKIGKIKAAKELGIPEGTLYGWVKAAENGSLDLGIGEQTPDGAMSLAAEVQMLRKQIKELEKKNQRLEEMNEFLEDAAAFFAASRRKSGKMKD